MSRQELGDPRTDRVGSDHPAGDSLVPEYSFVIPILNERETLEELYLRLAPVMDALDGPCEAIIVDDGSTDGSYEIMEALNERDPRVRPLRLTRNFGHQIAITAGLDHAEGHAVIVMDGDLQDPPELALELARKWREGFQIVYAVRDHRTGESRAKLATARWFYRLLGRLSDVPMPYDAGDFRLVDRAAVHAVSTMREHRRYLRGMFAWTGYRQTAVHYTRAARHAGSTKFPLHKMASFASDGILSFSAVPLTLALYIGFAVSVVSFIAGAAVIALTLAGAEVVPGWASLAVALAFLSGVQLTMVGVVGAYVGRIYDEVKQRPLYLVDHCEKPDRTRVAVAREANAARSTDVAAP